MTYKEIQDEVLTLRFGDTTGSGKRPRVKSWINMRYQYLWNYRNWSFKRVPSTSIVVAVSGGIASGTMPTDFAKSLALYEPSGQKLMYVQPDDFEEWYVAGTPTSATTPSSVYTVINRKAYIGPAAAGTYKLAYQRRIAHVNASGDEVPGILSLDSDEPVWPAEHDYVLVLEAILQGQRIEGDPTDVSMQQARDEYLAAMVNDLVWDVEGEAEQWAGVGALWR